MSVIRFLAANWDSVLVVIATIALIGILVFKKQWNLLDQILFGLVTWAEREYGGRTGALKLAAVIEKAYPHIPAIVRIFITEKQVEQMVDKALEAAKLKWEKNPKLIESSRTAA